MKSTRSGKSCHFIFYGHTTVTISLLYYCCNDYNMSLFDIYVNFSVSDTDNILL